jgi:aminotransferase
MDHDMTQSRSALVAAGKVYRTRGISRRVAQITISAIKEMPLLASKLDDCVSLGQGIPSFPTPNHIREAVCRTIRDNGDCGKYTLGPGMPELRRAVAGYLSGKLARSVDPDTEVCITVGAMEALSAAVLTVVDRGDEVLLPSPNYASHIEQVLLAEGKPVFIPLREADWQLDVAGLHAAVTPRTRAIILCSPHNPTGANFAEEDLRALAELAIEKDLFVICDETYDFLVYGQGSHFSLTTIPELQERIIATFSFSKKYAMTGWRVGYVYAAEEVLDQIMKIHDAVAICAPTLSQHAALAALNGSQECVAEIRAALQKRRDLTCERLDDLGEFLAYVPPQGAYYLMTRYLFPGIDSMTFALKLLHEARVITIPGAAFGPNGEDHVRISFGGTEGDINEAFDRIHRWLHGNPFRKSP